MQSKHHRKLFLALTFLGLLFIGDSASAQKPGRTYRNFPAYGFKFKPLRDWSDVPVNERLKKRSVIGQFEAERPLMVKYDGNNRATYKPALKVVRIMPEAASTGSGAKKKKKEWSVKDFVDDLSGSLVPDSLEDAEVETSIIKMGKGLQGTREVLTVRLDTRGDEVPIVWDVTTIVLSDFKVVFAWDYPGGEKKVVKSWSSAVKKAMATFRIVEIEERMDSGGPVTSDSSYEVLLAHHKRDVAQTPGWDLIETPSKQYLIKTNSEDRKDLKAVVARLEASRLLFEQDFPPSSPILQISIVRICATQEDFNTYGQTGGGVAGYFNPRSEELVLYFPQGSAKMTMSVMTHECFHQYCHFLFERSAAHRWFDEGHGDYYGAWKMRGRKLVPNDDMDLGLARTPEIKKMFRDGTVKPLSKHIRFNHPEWQGQGPSNVSCYAQSFSIIYFLREGARGQVKRSYWKKEYGQIIPNYIKTLNDGFRGAYAEIREDAQNDLDDLDADEAEGKEGDRLRERLENPWTYLGLKDKLEIWDAAMEASWGLVDEDEFEERWKKFVMKEM
ncbi:MAG TPA: hypothetical protein EYQ25_11735 [Planctomycetes bacterium]|nr:hypothetical protein [Planctomycetota bacterium]HIL36817.1 hypothetical protein [Planctomycetota bacterium]